MIKELKKTVLRFILFIVLSLLLAFTIRLFLCNFYVVPSDSMNPAILSGDFILAEKWSYGARIFTGLKFDWNSDPSMKRIPGFRGIRRNDVVVFNFPYRFSLNAIRMNLEEIYVKRCIGLPGDSISIVGGFYHVSGLSDTLGYIPGQIQMVRSGFLCDSSILNNFLYDQSFQWNIINFGPLYIPAAGRSIVLTPQNFRMYHKMIAYETHSEIRCEDSLIYIGYSLRNDYTFCTNWYFMAGDNVMNSNDSRYNGLIPEDYIIGRTSMIMTSKDSYTGKRRWNRTLKRIK